MIDDDQAKPTDSASPSAPKPEEMGHPVTGKGEAIEPEATHNISDGAVRAADRMWGPPGMPKDTKTD